jgi:GMP synthase-like glutamine amidotransferase
VPTLVVLHHFVKSKLGQAAAPLREAELDVQERYLDRGDPLPGVDGLDGLLVLGGDETAVDLAPDSLLRAEARLMAEAAAAGVPTLGVCLGAQLLASGLGAPVRHVGRIVRWHEARKLAAADGDPLFGTLPDPVPALYWNEDVCDLPDGADLLVEPIREGVSAFRAAGAPAWGVQFHPDVDREVLEEWLLDYGDEIDDPAAFRQASGARMAAQDAASRALFAGFARLVARR